MNATDCEDADHERCERCSGCVPCGCLCHLAGEGTSEEMSEEAPEIRFGLRPFMQEAVCPKCASSGVHVVYHPAIVMTVGSGQHPCAAWLHAGILTGDVSAHLCLECMRCGYGWPTKTADASPVEGLE